MNFKRNLEHVSVEVEGVEDGVDNDDEGCSAIGKLFDKMKAQYGPTLGICYMSAAQCRLENTKRTSINREIF